MTYFNMKKFFKTIFNKRLLIETAVGLGMYLFLAATFYFISYYGSMDLVLITGLSLILTNQITNR